MLLIVALGVSAYWQRERIAALVNAVRGPGGAGSRRTPSAQKPKIPDRVGQPRQEIDAAAAQPQSASAAPVAAVAQRVVLYEEDPADPQGKRYVGSVIWRTEMRPATRRRRPISRCAPISKFRSGA